MNCAKDLPYMVLTPILSLYLRTISNWLPKILAVAPMPLGAIQNYVCQSLQEADTVCLLSFKEWCIRKHNEIHSSFHDIN